MLMVLTLERGLCSTERVTSALHYLYQYVSFLVFPVPQGTQELVKQVKNLPQANYNLLKYICK